MKIKIINNNEVTQEFDSYEELINYMNSTDSFTQIVVMKSYRLEAMLSDKLGAFTTFQAENDDQATLKAIEIIMNRAKNDKRWAKGKIELYRGKTLLREMEAK